MMQTRALSFVKSVCESSEKGKDKMLAKKKKITFLRDKDDLSEARVV